MTQKHFGTRRDWKRRALSLLLAAVMLLGLVPGFPGADSEASAHWADPYLSQLVEWGFIRRDQANNPDRALTRADFMGIVNRAYGYHEVGETPFEDVRETDWFYDDVGIAYTAKYIMGTSPTTASPNSPLTRETAATILGRNMMLEESPGELVDFSDAHRISTWAAGTIKSSLEHYLVSGYDDGTFRPQRNVSWGEMASMLTNLVGTPLQEPGDYSLGGVYGNVTITSSDVTLRDTVISGDLYISGGVGLGGIKLENVTVLGRIIASGTGNSEGGEASILLRNVTADEMLVDNLQGNYVSIRADGITEIGRTTIRTSAYIEDNTPDGLGLHYISLEGESYPEGEEPEDWTPIQLDLAGRIQEVVNRTPRSQVHVGAGTVEKLTVDEAAEGSNVIIDRGAVVKELNLDTGTIVTGEGDIGHLVVNAPGCEVEMLPDVIEIRPGITAIIAGEEMDTVAGQESSEQPLILAGYPQAQDIVPTGLDAAFMTNKAGTVYWAVTAITDGSVGEEDLIKPPSYGSLAVAKGSVKVAKGNEETISKVTGLLPGGSYYLSAVLVDARGQRSPVKVIAFTTPDNTTPAFCAGYPYMSKVSRTDSVVVAMPNKTCKLYYALLPAGATAPTEAELKAAAVSGALGYGVRDVTKNVEDTFRVNDVILDEQTQYVLYLWLVDADGINKGQIVSLPFTTDDETPPYFIRDPYPASNTANSVNMQFQISEPGTVYWVAFPSGSVKNFPLPAPGSGDKTAPLNSEHARLQVVNAMNIGPDGKSGRVTVKANADGSCVGNFNITGMKPETPYDVYYVIKDNAGPDRNYSLYVGKTTVTPKDGNPPVVKQLFSHTRDAKDKTKDPYADTAIYLDVSENVGFEGGRTFVDLYNDYVAATGDTQRRAQNLLASALHDAIKLMQIDQSSRNPTEVKYINNTSQLTSKPFDEQLDVTIDYTQAVVEYYPQGSQSIRITFPSSALHLEYGGHYYFTVEGLTDLSNNPMEPAGGMIDFWNYPEESALPGHNVPDFLVQFASVEFSEPVIASGALPTDATTGKDVQMTRSASFRMEPLSTSGLSEIYNYDVVIWTDNKLGIAYDLYYRMVDKSSGEVVTDEDDYKQYRLPGTEDKDSDGNHWIYLGPSSPPASMGSERTGRSLNLFFNGCDASDYTPLNTFSDDLYYDFVISVTQFDGKLDPSTWRGPAKFYINVAAGQANNLINLNQRPSPDGWDELERGGILGGLQSIGHWDGWEAAGVDSDTMLAYRNLSPTGLPSFIAPSPTFTTTEDSVTINVGLSDLGDIYYAISELDEDGQPKLDTYRALMKADMEEDENGELVPRENVELHDGTFSDTYFISNGQVKDEFADELDEEMRLMLVTLNDPQPPEIGGITATRPILPWMKGGGPTVLSTPDSPMLNNLVVSPTNQQVVGGIFDQGDVADSDKFTPSEGGRADYKLGAKLKPDTDYFIYLVITLPDQPNDMSHVYIYHFKTQKPMLPRVKLEGERVDEVGENGKKETVKTGNVIMEIDAVTEGKYQVFTQDWVDAHTDFFMQPFKEFLAHTGADAEGPADPDDPDSGTVTTPGTDKTPEIYKGENFTVLDALKTAYSFLEASKDDPDYHENTRYTGNFYYPNDYIDSSNDREQINGFWEYDAGEVSYSVFDMYASDTAKQTLYTLITNTQPDSRGGSQKTAEAGKNLTNDLEEDGLGRTTLNCGEPLDDGSYVIFTYSINPNMKDSDFSQNHPNNTYRIASFSALEFDKGLVGGPKPTYILGEMRKNDGVYSGYVQVYFDRYTYINKVSLANVGNALLTGPGVQKPSTGTVTTGILTVQSFMLDYNSDSGNTVQFPGGYFTDSEGDKSDNPLTIRFQKDSSGKEYVEVLWGKDTVVGTIPIEESAGRTLLIRGDKEGDNPPVLTLDLSTAGKDKGNLTAEVSETGGLDKDSIEYRWDRLSGDKLIGTSPDLGATSEDGKIEVTAKAPGIAWITASGSGLKTGSGGRESFPNKDVKIIIQGKITDLASTSADWNDTTNTLTLPYGGTGSAPNNVITVEANGQSVSDTAEVVILEKTGAAANYVNCVVNEKNSITVTFTGRPAANFIGDATITVGLKARGENTDLTPDNDRRMTFTVHLEPAPATTSTAPASTGPNKAPAKTPTLSLTPAAAITLTGTGKTAGVTAAVANGTATKYAWTSSNPNVVAVSGSGNRTTLTAKAIGYANITCTATVNGQTLTKTVKVNVQGALTGVKLNSPTNSSSVTMSGTTLTLKRGGALPAATLGFTANGTINSSAKLSVLSVKTSDNKDGSKYLSITEGTNTLTVKPGAAAPASNTTLTVTVGIKTNPLDGSSAVSLTPTAASQLTFKVTISGNDANVNIAGTLGN